MSAVKVQSFSEQVMDKIMELVAERRLQPGDKLPTEKELTELFGVGRSTIREAIVQLQNLGVLTVRQGKGTFLNKVSADTLLSNHDPIGKFLELDRNEIRDVMEVRKLLETEIVKRVAEQATPEDIAELKEALAKQCEAKSPLLAYERDQDFHLLLARLSGNSMLPITLRLLRSFLDRYSSVIVSILDTAEYSEKILEHHRQILEAIEDKDPTRATQAMMRHLNTGQFTILASFDIFVEKRRLQVD